MAHPQSMNFFEIKTISYEVVFVVILFSIQKLCGTLITKETYEYGPWINGSGKLQKTAQIDDVYSNIPQFMPFLDELDHHRYQVMPWCSAYMHAYATASAQFIECAIHHARPLSFCENCVQQYKIVIDLVKEIDKQDKVRPTDPSMPAVNCVNSLLSSDMINIVGSTFEFIKKLWLDSYCDGCFDHYLLVNGTVEYAFSNSTVVFKRMYNDTRNCMDQFIEIPLGSASTSTYNKSACDVCGDLYDDLNKYYALIDDHGVICMDIVDTMNYTRTTWSKKFHCTLQQKDLAAVLTVTGVFCLLPIVFYSAAKLHGARKHMKIVKQRRMSTAAHNVRDPTKADAFRSTPSTSAHASDEKTYQDIRTRSQKDGNNPAGTDTDTNNDARFINSVS